MALERIVVTADRMDDTARRYDTEDGEYFTIRIWYYAVSFRTAYGIEWTLRHTFADNAAGAAQAARMARLVQARIDHHGTARLDVNRWNQRVIYGSPAYSDEESAIVQREREDALLDI